MKRIQVEKDDTMIRQREAVTVVRNMDFPDFVERKLCRPEKAPYSSSSGKLEEIEETNSRIATAIGILIEELHVAGALDVEQIKKILDINSYSDRGVRLSLVDEDDLNRY